jgi:hypothetical protein
MKPSPAHSAWISTNVLASFLSLCRNSEPGHGVPIPIDFYPTDSERPVIADLPPLSGLAHVNGMMT